MSGPDMLRGLLDGAFPLEEPDLDAGWSDVLSRVTVADGARRPHGDLALRAPGRRVLGSRRRSALVIALALVVLLCGTALAASTDLLDGPLGSFREWLGVGPGRPAAPAVQRTFSQANAASVAHFPRGTALRLLIGREIGGGRYELYGFRSGSSLCLQLDVAGAQAPPSCAPVRQLQGRQPAHLLVAGRPVQIGGRAWTVSYGLATDAVRTIQIVQEAGRHRAVLADNAFVYAAPGRERPLGAIAIEARGDEVPIALTRTAQASPGGGYERFQRAPGMSREAGRPAGTLGWLLHRRPLGAPLRSSMVSTLLPAGARLLYARQVRPDRSGNLRVGVALIDRGGEQQVCEILYEPLAGRLAGCAAAGRLFDGHYVVGRMLAGVAGGQSYVLVGLASPHVFKVTYLHAGMEMFHSAHLRDGIFAIPMPVSSSAMWLQIDGRKASRPGTVLESGLESGAWRPPGSG